MKDLSLVLMFLMGGCVTLQAAELDVIVTDNDGHPITDAVVMATPTDVQAKPQKSQKTVVIDQVDKEFVHYVTVIPTGAPVQFPNSDNIRHHVYSFSPVKQFELPLYMGTPAKPVIFDKPGVVKLGCNIHDWMVGYLYITDVPYFKASDEAGKVALTGLPTGNYHVKIWHPRMELSDEDVQKIVVLGDKEKSNVSFQLPLKPELRPRRAPLPIQPSY